MNGRIFVTGDKHGNFNFLHNFCRINKTSTKDVLVVLGDAGLNFHGGWSATEMGVKRKIAQLPITLLLIRGNHEQRPSDCNFELINHDIVKGLNPDDPIIPDKVYVQSEFPNILYAIDGGCYSIYGQSCLCIGGAYSVDKEWRLLMNRFWAPNEELSQTEMMDILDKVWHHNYNHVFTHTCPDAWQPRDLFLTFVDQSKVSKKMEQFLEDVTRYIDYDHWWFGHFHGERTYVEERACMTMDGIYELKAPDRYSYVGYYSWEEYIQ